MARLIASAFVNRSLDAVIEQKGLLDQASVQKYLEQSLEENEPLEVILVRDAGLSREDVYQALAESFRLPFFSGENAISVSDMPEKLAAVCTKENLLVVDFTDSTIIVATSQPGKTNALEALFAALGYSVEFQVCAPPLKVAPAIAVGDDSLQNDLASGISDLMTMLSDSTDFPQKPVEKSTDITGKQDVSSLVELVNKTLLLAVHQRTSDIHIESIHGGARVRFRIDGVLVDRFDIEGNTASSFISRLLIMSGLDITEKVMPQDGSFKVTCDDRDVEFRIACIPGIYGQNVVLRILSGPETQKLNLPALGMLPDELDLILTAAKAPHGMILVAGPTGSGKSTTLYGVLEAISDPKLKFITIEDPVERRMNGVQQIQVRLNNNEPERSLTFARGLRTILRLDPDIIMVGEIRDAETAQISIQASLTGHLVLSTVHANSSVETLRRLYNIGVDFHLLMSSLNLIFAQRLMRRLCSCKQGRPPTARENELLEKTPVNQIFVAAGCPSCMESGYRGRVGIFEFLPISEFMRDIVAKNGLTESIIQIREARLRTLKESALQKVSMGLTDFTELERVCGPCL